MKRDWRFLGWLTVLLAGWAILIVLLMGSDASAAVAPPPPNTKCGSVRLVDEERGTVRVLTHCYRTAAFRRSPRWVVAS